MLRKIFISITDLSTKEIWLVLNLAKKLKSELNESKSNQLFLQNKTMVMIFEKPSLRTRLSFEIAMTQLGGHAIHLTLNDIGLGVRESIQDIAKVTSSMGDIIMARTFKHETIEELAKFSTKPVINGLTDLEHPCQILADLLTIFEKKEHFNKLKLAYLGDSENNVTHSLALASGLLGMDFVTASPKGYWMNKKIVKTARELAKESGGSILETIYPKVAVKGANIVYTDTWVSMGDNDKDKRLEIFKDYQVNPKLMKYAKEDTIFMHCLPAYRGNEVTSEVIDGKQSVVFQEAENRLHVQKALLLFLLGKI